MKIKTTILLTIAALILAVPVAAQDAGQPGFVIKLKNGSMLRGRTLSRDDNGALRLVMTEASDSGPRSYAVIAAEDTAEITSSSSDTESIRIKLKGGSDLRCKEFSLSGDAVAVKLGSASKVEIKVERYRIDKFRSVTTGLISLFELTKTMVGDTLGLCCAKNERGG